MRELFSHSLHLAASYAITGLHPLQPSRLQNNFSRLLAPGHTSEVYGLAYSPDGQRFATGGGLGDETIRLWAASGQLLRILPVNHREVVALAFSPDGKLVASDGLDQTSRLWDYHSGQALLNLQVDAKTVNGEAPSYERSAYDFNDSANTGTSSLGFSPDGQLLASAHPAGYLRLWNPASGEEISTTPAQDATGSFL